MADAGHTSQRQDHEPVKAALRESILRNFAIAPGTSLLGVTIEKRRLHSIRSAAREYKLHQLTPAKPWLQPDRTRRRSSSLFTTRGRCSTPRRPKVCFDRAANAIPIKRPAGIHGHRSIAVSRLIAEGYVTYLIDTRRAEGLAPVVDREDVDAFLTVSMKVRSLCLIRQQAPVRSPGPPAEPAANRRRSSGSC